MSTNNQLITLSRRIDAAEKALAGMGIRADAPNQRAALIAQLVAARPDVWTKATATALETSMLERLVLHLNPGAFQANGLVVNCDEEEEKPMPWPAEWRL